MFFTTYKLYEDKLSEKLDDDNPLKQKLIEMETPTDHHPIYTGLVWSLLIYSWIFFIILFYKQINLSVVYNIKMAISACNIIFVTFCIKLCYKKDYMVSTNPIYRRNAYIIFALTFIFSTLIATIDSGTATKKEILETFCIFCTITPKSYIALAIISYIALGITMSFYSCPYEIYRGFYSVHQTFREYKTEKILINKSMKFPFLIILVFLPFIYSAFNKDSSSSFLKNASILIIFGTFPLGTTIFLGKIYYKYFEKAAKLRKD